MFTASEPPAQAHLEDRDLEPCGANTSKRASVPNSK
jgi:hypothetical protein